jgi:hypothetical protein
MSRNRPTFIDQRGNNRQHHATRVKDARPAATDMPPPVGQRSIPAQRSEWSNASPNLFPPVVPTEAATQRRSTTFWTSLWGSMMEGFVLYGASIHPTAFLPAAYYGDEQPIHSPNTIARPYLISPSAASEDGLDDARDRP